VTPTVDTALGPIELTPKLAALLMRLATESSTGGGRGSRAIAPPAVPVGTNPKGAPIAA
jgi:hypothetical protein